MQNTGGNDLRQRKFRKLEDTSGVDSSPIFGSKDTSSLLPTYVGYGIIIIFLLVIKFFSIFENILPEQIKLENAGSHPDRFIGERAELQLKRLTNLGTRVVGSYENEVLAVDFLKREIMFIAQEANKNYKIELDVQKPTGSYYLLLKPHGFKNYYANIQNVVVKLSSGNSVNSVLMNCHYDTVPESPGASDNGVNCVVMLEILRVLSKGTTPLKNNVIFLFNGAEENPLQASHGFLSQHKWRDEVKVVINLDSAGAGGREILFQTSGEPWLAEAYARAVPRPTAGVQAEELFHYGIIPSDTDFRIFRDFGGYPGFDIAHCTNGYVYHTKFDKMEFVRPGVYQNTGDNMLALVRELVNSSEVGVRHPKTRVVYFDIFTFFTVAYTEEVGVVLNLAVAFLSICAVYKSHKNSDRTHSALKTIGFSTGGQVLALLLAGAVVFFISKTLDFYKSTMVWYLRPWMIVPLYSFPIVFTLAAILILSKTFLGQVPRQYSTIATPLFLASVFEILLVPAFTSFNREIFSIVPSMMFFKMLSISQCPRNVILERRIIYFITGAQLFWTFVLLAGTLWGIRSSFILMLIVLFPSIGCLSLTVLNKDYRVKTYLIVYLSGLMFPLLFTLCQTVRVFIVIIPMTARMGPHTNSELIIGALTFLCSAVYLSQLVPFLLLLKKLKKFLLSLFVIHLLAMVVVTTTSFGFPYDGDVHSPALQRFYVMHCERTFHDEKGSIRRSDSGFFVLSLDRNSVNYVTERLPELQKAATAAADCPTEIFCGYPVFTSRFIRPAAHSYWVPALSPAIHHPTSLEVVNQTQISANVRRIRILVTGPDHITVGLSPRVGVKMVKWSFDASPPIDVDSSDGRKTYMVYYSHGLMGGTLEFDVDLEIHQNHSGQDLDVAVIGHYMHDKKFRTKEFTKFLSKFPDWAHLTPWTTTYKSWVI